MKKYLKYLGNILVLGIFCLAIFLLYHKLKAYSFSEIQDSIAQIPYWRLFASVGLMIVNYIILVGYDYIALVAIKKPLPLAKTALVSFVGQTVSYNFGALLGGTTVRYRLYSVWGFSIEEIVRLVLMLAVTFWVGALGLCGGIFLFNPPDIPVELLAKMPLKDIRILGAILLSISMSYLVMCHFVRKPLHIFGKEFVFPTLKIAIAQAVVAGIDLIVAAACMYILLPSELNVGFFQFLPSYLLAQVAVVLTHVPGGVGVFELVILHLTHTPQEQLVVASVLCFRIIYFILPLLSAALILAIYEMRVRKDFIMYAGRWLSVMSHSMTAWAVFSVGSLSLIISLIPDLGESMLWHSDFIAPWLMQISHFITILSSTCLIFAAYSLELRQKSAWRFCVLCLIFGIISSILSGVRIFIPISFALVLFAVYMAKDRFYRHSLFLRYNLPLRWFWLAWGVFLSCLGLAYALIHDYVMFEDLLQFPTGSQMGDNFQYMFGLLILLIGFTLYRLWRIKKIKSRAE